MKIFMIGGTGLLGCEAATTLIKRGHQVKSVALPPLPEGAPIPKEMELVFGDINKKTDEEIEQMLEGCDCFIFAAGVDERKEFPAPVMDYYYKYNIAPLERIFPLCKKAGVKRAVVLGSYFSYLSKIKPDMNLEERNPYFKSRLIQEDVCKKACDDNFSVAVLELPYIFGTQPGRRPVWTVLISRFPVWTSFLSPFIRRVAQQCLLAVRLVRLLPVPQPKRVPKALRLFRSACTI